MSSKRISLAFTALTVTAFGWAVACSSSSNNNAGDGGSTSNTTSTTGTSNTSTTGTSGSSTSGTSTTGGGSLLIDDMSNTTGQVHVAAPAGESPGYWFTTINDTGGSITPAAAGTGPSTWVYTAVSGPSDAAITMGACINGVTSPKQYSEAGMGFNFAIQKIDAAADSGVQAPAVEYDISAHMGIQFWAFGAADAGTQSVRVLFPDHGTDPRGGVCPPDATDSTQCYDSWQDTISVAPGWQLVTIHYEPVGPGTSGDLTQLGFGMAEPNGFDDKHVYGVTFQINGPQTADAGTGTPFNLCVADIMFVNN